MSASGGAVHSGPSMTDIHETRPSVIETSTIFSLAGALPRSQQRRQRSDNGEHAGGQVADRDAAGSSTEPARHDDTGIPSRRLIRDVHARGRSR